MQNNPLPGEKHLTASVWITTKSSPKKVLLVLHKKFNKWIQPGGHVDFGENPVVTAVRETKEETGIDIGFLLSQITSMSNDSRSLPIPRYFLEEDIPAHKDQPAHFHLDIMYVVEIDEQQGRIREEESQDIKWFRLEEVTKIPLHDNSRKILSEILQ